MSIGVGFLCKDGAVLCTDTQETIGPIKSRVPKLVIKPEIDYPGCSCRILFAGAGDGAFIDKLVSEAWDEVLKTPRPLNVEQAAETIEQSIQNTHEELAPCFQPGYMPQVDLIYAVWVPGSPIRMFQSLGPVVNRADKHVCIGSGVYLARFLLDRMIPFEGALTVEQTLAFASYVIARVKDHVDGCGGDTLLAGATNDGQLHRMDWKTDRLTMVRLENFENQIAHAMFAMIDPKMDDKMMERHLEIMTDQLRESRRQHREALKSVADIR